MKLKLSSLLAAALLGLGIAGCTPPPASGTIVCGGGSGTLDVSPAVDPVEKPITYTLVGSSSTAACADATGTGITNARIESLAVTFPALSCAVQFGTRGTGPAVVRWSDGTTSTAAATATLEAAYGGRLDLRLTSGHFAGSTGSTSFSALPVEGSCFDGGITRESISVGDFVFRR